jgi:hypothetical protein
MLIGWSAFVVMMRWRVEENQSRSQITSASRRDSRQWPEVRIAIGDISLATDLGDGSKYAGVATMLHDERIGGGENRWHEWQMAMAGKLRRLRMWILMA